ncbi:MAG TPA: hypothetical protein VLI68_09040 [Hanamia sp.]|jgi:hypothetical protein|nr:hypothetical protein [Hanamia sp.]
MEVHHHPDLHHKKKNFKEYFLEFLMIFLAVTLGFIAENIREKITEHHRAKIYAAEMVNDLVSDTIQLRRYINYMTNADHNVDTLFQLLSAHQPKEIPSGKLYWYGLFGAASEIFVPNDATFEQMKSSGSLSYFAHSSLAKKVAEYDLLCRSMKSDDNSDEAIYVEVRKIRAQIFEFNYNAVANNIYQANRVLFDQKRIDSFLNSNPPLLTYDKTIFNVYEELVRSRFFDRKVDRADTLYRHAVALIGVLKKE